MVTDNKIPLICIVGPTASGKTKLSIELAKYFDGEIVSADSMQIYKGMDIATAKPDVDERQGVKHHLMDFLDIEKTFSVAQYCELAHSAIKDIYNRGKMPILVGGTGLYVDSLIKNTVFSLADSDPLIRSELQMLYDENGVQYLIDMLGEFDPDMATKLSVERNVKRIIRAIEVFRLTGVTMTEHNHISNTYESPYKVVKIGLTAINRDYLYNRINNRVDLMVENGLVEEAKSYLVKKLSDTSCMAIGHKELAPYFKGELSLESCLENLKMQTRRYAKRQLTWFKRDTEIHWFNIDDILYSDILSESVDLIKKVLFDEKRNNN